jgi:multiple sugar transport system ATP-binding protein
VASISLRRVSKVHTGGLRALDDLSLDVDDGHVVVVLGGPASGKTTLLRVVAGLERPTRGEVVLDGVPVTEVPPAGRGVGVVFRTPALYPGLTVAANIAFPLVVAAAHRAAIEAATRTWARTLGLTAVLDRRPAELDDEQQQRVAVARAMVRAPRVLLLDEPVSRLAERSAARLLAEIVWLVRETGTTAVFATSHRGDAPAVADAIAVLREGRVEDVGPPDRVYSRPGTAFVAGLVGGAATALLAADVELDEGACVAVWLAVWASFGVLLGYLLACELAHFHGDPVVVGVPPEALRLVAPARNAVGAPVLQGVVRRVVPLGPRSDVAVDVGGTAVVLDRDRRPGRLDPAGGVVTAAAGGRHLRHALRRDLSTIPRASTDRPAELTVRTARADAPQVGERVFLAVDLALVHFFDACGRRIRSGWR